MHRAEFGVITPADGTTVKLNDDRRIVDIEFASGAVEIPLFRENGSLRADVPISHDASAWRLRQAGMTGFPRHGCFSYDFLESGIFVSPSQRVVGQRFVVHNAGTKAVTILAESDQDWLTLEPSKFRLRAGSNDSIRLLLLLEKLAEGEHHATVQLRYQRETIKARIHVSISPGPPRPALQRPDVELAIAGMQDSVSIALEFVGQNQQIVEGSVWDPLHRLRKTFRSVVQNGRARATVTLPTSELIKSIYATWPLRVFVHSTKEIFEQVLLVRLVRQLFFEPSMPVLAPGKDVSVRVLRHDGAQIQLLVEDSPSELKTRVEGVCLVIQAQKQLAGRGALQWIRLRDEISGERAMLPARL
ncbi:MAG TPA: hypothetical protein VN223_01325 [Candidatus Elarobacter sp.]|nr:hypothetical protein [Candidatus Elarobacter sp.]